MNFDNNGKVFSASNFNTPCIHSEIYISITIREDEGAILASIKILKLK